MHRHVLVALLKAVVLSNVVKVVSADDDGPLHLHLGHHARQDASSDRDVTGKRAFLVNVGALDGLKGSGRERGGQQVVPENRGCGPRETNYNSQQPSEQLFRGGQGDSAWAHVQGDRGRESFFKGPRTSLGVLKPRPMFL